MIDSMRDDFSINELCDALDVSRAGYHAALKRGPAARTRANRCLLDAMRRLHSHRFLRTYGSPRLTDELRAMGFACSENRVAGLMRRHGLRARSRKPFRPRTTTPDHAACPSPNLLRSMPPPDAPGRQMVSDITYIPTRQGWLYLAVVVDLFSRAVLAWRIEAHMRADLVASTIAAAIAAHRIPSGAILHSDRGSQYSSSATRAMLARHGLRQSMSASGCCYDNAFAESFFASLKTELPGDGLPFESPHLARTTIFDYIETFYNRRRRHSSLGMRSPHDFLRSHFQSRQSTLN